MSLAFYRTFDAPVTLRICIAEGTSSNLSRNIGYAEETSCGLPESSGDC
jgi:hypothetical protein